MMDKENIGAILQEMSDERKIPTDSQKKVADFFVNLVMKLEKGDKEAVKILNMTPQELQQLAFQNYNTILKKANDMRDIIYKYQK